MTRPNTPDVKTETGTRITVKRCCNGCGRQLGDATQAECEAAVYGRLLPDVRHECGCTIPCLSQALIRQAAIAIGGVP